MNKASRYHVPESELVTHLVEDRRASLSPWGRGNSKLGSGIYTYSKLPVTTCPGASEECLAVCYARKLDPARTNYLHPVWQLWSKNSARGDELPPLPADAKIVRIHVSGDFDTVLYIDAWRRMVSEHPDVTFFGYTRSWRVPELRWALGLLAVRPNVHLWASIDKSIEELPDGWRRAWIEGDSRVTKVTEKTYRTFDGYKAILCPEGAGLLPNCQTCRFCFLPHNMDLVFPLH
jgi:hypothetical protein